MPSGEIDVGGRRPGPSRKALPVGQERGRESQIGQDGGLAGEGDGEEFVPAGRHQHLVNCCYFSSIENCPIIVLYYITNKLSRERFYVGPLVNTNKQTISDEHQCAYRLFFCL